MYLFVGPGTLKFKTVPLDVTEEAERAAREALCPPSPIMSGEEVDIFSKGGYLSLQGQIKELRGVRMTRAHIPVLDLSLKCGQSLLDVSLWRDEALFDLYTGDEVVLTHLRPCILPNGKGKFQSSNYTTLKIAEGQIVEKEVDIIGVSDMNQMCNLLSSDLDVYTVPQHIYCGSIDRLVHNLPLKIIIKHINQRVISIESVQA
ncbi:uncharacterized protein LOC127641695 [Xyrauchen texanus]|uniref:uncharacterized protein LOC127641695 n=1 Tax=Xyrauchen texanus TaxID=154827 RepID=UPI0022420755|nr:uncharacterized protein LOC127641695 [Xyrauchen texanus]